MRFKYILVLLILSNYVLGQNVRSYHVENWISDYDLGIYFFNDSTYYLEANKFLSDDILTAIILGYGKYKDQGERLKIYDELGNFKLFIKVWNDSLMFENGPDFLRGFKLKSFPSGLDKKSICAGIDSSLTRRSLEEEISRRILFQDSIIVSTSGRYKNIYHDFELRFFKEGVYRFAFGDKLISRGVWRRNGGLLELEDIVLKSKFYLFQSENNNLEALVLPFGAFVNFKYNPD